MKYDTLTHPSFTDRTERQRAFVCEEELKSIEFSTGVRMKLDYTHNLLQIDDRHFPQIFRFDEIKAAHLQVDEVNSSGKATSSVLGRAALFGLLTGGAGAIVGALSARNVHKRTVKRVTLVVAVEKWPFDFKHILFASGYFKGYLVDQAERIGAEVVQRLTTEEVAAGPVNLAEQFSSLADLHGRGLLSDTEFTEAKKKLLN